MSASVGYHGNAFSPAGDKGRFVLPPAFRKAVKESSGGSRILCLAAHHKYDCLVGFGLSRIDELHRELDEEAAAAVQMKNTDFDRDVRAAQLFGFEQLPFDDSGRFVMPEYLRDLGKVDGGLYFQGSGRFFMVWAPEELKRTGPEWKSARAACERLMAAAKKGSGE